MGWICQQLETFNIFMLITIVFLILFYHALSIQKILKEESKEIYNQFEEVKDTIRDNK